MNKIAFCLLTTKISPELEKRINNIEQGNPNIDFFILLDSKEDNSKWEENNGIIKFDGLSIWKKYNRNFIGSYIEVGNPQFIIPEFAKIHQDYEYYWFCEDDIYMPNGKYDEFFKECNNIECDLLLMYPLDNSKQWYWNSWINPRNINMYPIHTWVQLFRLSRGGQN